MTIFRRSIIIKINCLCSDAKFNYFNLYGKKQGFVCYQLRYFLALTTRTYLYINRWEFEALFASVFHSHKDVQKYQTMCIKPSIRCVTIANWFQVNYITHIWVNVFLLKILDLLAIAVCLHRKSICKCKIIFCT